MKFWLWCIRFCTNQILNLVHIFKINVRLVLCHFFGSDKAFQFPSFANTLVGSSRGSCIGNIQKLRHRWGGGSGPNRWRSMTLGEGGGRGEKKWWWSMTLGEGKGGGWEKSDNFRWCWVYWHWMFPIVTHNWK